MTTKDYRACAIGRHDFVIDEKAGKEFMAMSNFVIAELLGKEIGLDPAGSENDRLKIRKIAAVIVKARISEATNWHQFGDGHDSDGWCCKREEELRNELWALG
jgi:hypothetical protein